MLETIKSLFSRGAKSVPPPPASVLKNTAEMSGQGLDLFETDADPGDYGISRYPPIDQGIPRLGINPILRSQQDLLERIFRSAGVSREDFDKYYHRNR